MRAAWALQDQHFDLTRYQRGSEPNADAALARKFVVEGDAMLSSVLYLASEKTHSSELDPERTAALFAFLARSRGQIFLTTTRRDLIVAPEVVDHRRDFTVLRGELRPEA